MAWFSRAIVGWAAATTKQTRLVLDAVDMALCDATAPAARPDPGWWPPAARPSPPAARS
ncbi:hypothetical protein [Actinomadura soli]|uniref:hypothetical protein n=1 Tax=Actinomadura soli TaxID=2508997 RepID=UPI001486E006|nr:hypothetical protein [Actinomadura soli]